MLRYVHHLHLYYMNIITSMFIILYLILSTIHETYRTSLLIYQVIVLQICSL